MKYASNMQTPLVSVVLQQCARLLSRARLDETLNHALRLELENVHARLKIWAGNVGAFAPGNASVDYRLREDPDVADVVVSMLKSLRSSLEQAISPPLVEEEEEDDSRMTSQMPMETASISSDKTASSPALSLDSEVTGSDDGVTTKTDKHDDSRGSEEALRKANDIISRLYQLASVIRKPESSSENARVRDFMTKLKSKGETFDVEDAQDHAQSHLLARFPNTPPFLAQRLVSAVVFRRMKLRYRQRHRDKLRQGIVDSFDSGHASDAEPERPAAPAESPSGPLGGQYGDRGAAQGVRGAQQQQRPSRTIFSATNASSVNRQQFPNYARSTALSGITRSAVPRRQKLDVPTPPQNIDEGLKKMECKFCMRIISSEERQEPRWTRHILKDIDPYICLFEHCDMENTLYKTEEEWLGHMQWQHTVVWSCQVRGHELMTFDSPEELEHHIRSDHPGSFTDVQLPSIVRNSASPAPDTFAVLTASLAAQSQADNPVNLIGHVCPICQKEFHQRMPEAISPGDNVDGDIQDHILHHLESVALLSLPIDNTRTGNSAESNRRQSIPDQEALTDDGLDLPVAYFDDSHDNPPDIDESSQNQEDSGPGNDYLTQLTYDGRWGEVFQVVKQPSLPQPEKDGLLLGWRQQPLDEETSSDSDQALPVAKEFRVACLRKKIGRAVEILKKSGTIDIEIKPGEKPLVWAAKNGHERLVEQLLEGNVDLEIEDTQWTRTPLGWAAREGHKAVMELLLAKNANIEARDHFGQTPLILAASQGQLEAVELLLQRNADIEAKDHQFKQTALTWATKKGYEDVVEFLLEQNANIETRDKTGQTPLIRAAKEGHLAIVKLFLDRHADIEAKDEHWGRAPIVWAAHEGREATVGLLLDNNADIETVTNAAETPLTRAAIRGRDLVVKLLLERNANIEAKDWANRTPLHWSAENSHLDVAKLLLERMTDAHIHDTFGKTPLDLALGNHDDQMVELLKAHVETDTDIDLSEQADPPDRVLKAISEFEHPPIESTTARLDSLSFPEDGQS